MSEQGLWSAVLASLGLALLAYLKAAASVAVASVDKFFDPKTPNRVLEDEAVTGFRAQVPGPVPEHFIRWLVRRACRNRRKIVGR